jgi:hypothetical protein
MARLVLFTYPITAFNCRYPQPPRHHAVGLDFVGINPVKALYWTAVINGLLAPFLLVAILVVASDRKLIAGPTEFTLGMERRSDYHGGNVRRGRRHVCCIACRSRCRRTLRLLCFAKLIVRTVQFGPAEPFFPGLLCNYRADEQPWRSAVFRPRGE